MAKTVNEEIKNEELRVKNWKKTAMRQLFTLNS